MRRENVSAVSGFASAAQRCPDRPGLVDEIGTLTWREIDQRCDAFAAALQALPGGPPRVIGLMCPQSPRLRRGRRRGQPDRRRSAAAEHLVRRTSPRRGGGPRGRRRRGLRRGVHRDRRPRAGRQARCDRDRRLDRRSLRARRLPDRREDDRRAHGPRAPTRQGEIPDDPADVGHHRNTQGRQDDGWRGQCTEGDPGPHPVAHRGSDRHRGADVSRMGLLAVDLRRDDGVHHHHAAQVRSRGDAGVGRPPPRDRARGGAGHVRPDYGTARRGKKPLQRTVVAVRRRIGVADAPRRGDGLHGPVR